MMYKVAGSVRNILNVVEVEAVRQLKVPPEFIQQHNLDPASVTNESLYRPLYKSDHLYSKLAPDCSFFNNRRQLIKKEELGYGEYRVVIAVSGLYIGSHAQEDKLASLHMRITQIQYRPVNVTCLLDPIPGLIYHNITQPLVQPFPQDTPLPQQQQQQQQQQQSQPTNTTKKGRRKQQLQRQNLTVDVQKAAELQRQNAMTDMQKAAAAAEVYSNDFFADLDI